MCRISLATGEPACVSMLQLAYHTDLLNLTSLIKQAILAQEWISVQGDWPAGPFAYQRQSQRRPQFG